MYTFAVLTIRWLFRIGLISVIAFTLSIFFWAVFSSQLSKYPTVELIAHMTIFVGAYFGFPAFFVSLISINFLSCKKCGKKFGVIPDTQETGNLHNPTTNTCLHCGSSVINK